MTQPDRSGRVWVGGCAEPGCPGELTAVLGAGEPVVTCDADAAHCWRSAEWTRLSRRVAGAAGTRWLSGANIARLWSMPTGSVYRLASTHGWRRRTQAGRTYYHEADVERTLSARADG